MSNHNLVVDLHDAFHLDGENLVVLLLKLTLDASDLGLVLGDLRPILIEAHLRDETAVDRGATHVVIALVSDQMRKLDPLTPGQTRVFGREGAIFTLRLDRSDVVIVDTETTLESGLLQDFGLALANLHRANRLEGGDGPLHVEERLHASGQSVEDGGESGVAHASIIRTTFKCQLVSFWTQFYFLFDLLIPHDR